tara:strand:+ start:87 stop:377 length:291 start_codon:yes stop_codon:yes gene_type:complete
MKNTDNKKKLKGGNRIKKIFKNFNVFSWLASILIFLSICMIIYLIFIATRIYINQPLVNGSKTLKVLFRPFPYAAVVLIILTMVGGIVLLRKSFKI